MNYEELDDKSKAYLEYYQGIHKDKKHDFTLFINLIKKFGIPIGIKNPSIRSELDYYDYSTEDIIRIDLENITNKDLVKRKDAIIASIILLDFGYSFEDININKTFHNKTLEQIVISLILNYQYVNIYNPNYVKIIKKLHNHGFFKEPWLYKTVIKATKTKTKDTSKILRKEKMKDIQNKLWDYKYLLRKNIIKKYKNAKNYIDYFIKMKINGVKNGYIIEDPNVKQKINIAKVKIARLREINSKK